MMVELVATRYRLPALLEDALQHVLEQLSLTNYGCASLVPMYASIRRI